MTVNDFRTTMYRLNASGRQIQGMIDYVRGIQDAEPEVQFQALVDLARFDGIHVVAEQFSRPPETRADWGSYTRHIEGN